MIKLLDCTLRDGGYINDWNFTRECYDKVSEQLQVAGLDFIELGIIGQHKDNNFKTKFSSLEKIPLPKKISDSTSEFAVMMTISEYRKLTISDWSDGIVKSIRYAFFKEDWKESIDYIEKLNSKGYKVFAQTMATFQYSDSELSELINAINKVSPYAFYIVDSFGTFYNKDVKRLFQLVNNKLNSEILFGFHSHNNLQMANSNSICFLEEAQDRDIILDASIYGMGRGAGNANTELLMQYLNSSRNTNYNVEIIWKLYTDFIAKIRSEYNWGYLPEQFLVAYNKVNPAYVWYLSNKGVKSLDKINHFLQRIPLQYTHTLNKEIADKLFLEISDGFK